VDVIAQDASAALLGREKAQQDSDQGALARPIRPQQADGTLGQLDIHAVQGLDPAIAEMQVLDLDTHFP